MNLNFMEWQLSKLIFAFTTRPDVEPHVTNDAQDWRCEFDLKSGVFTDPVRIPGVSRFVGQ